VPPVLRNGGTVRDPARGGNGTIIVTGTGFRLQTTVRGEVIGTVNAVAVAVVLDVDRGAVIARDSCLWALISTIRAVVPGVVRGEVTATLDVKVTAAIHRLVLAVVYDLVILAVGDEAIAAIRSRVTAVVRGLVTVVLGGVVGAVVRS